MIEFACAGRCPPRCLLSTGAEELAPAAVQAGSGGADAAASFRFSIETRASFNAFSASAALTVRSGPLAGGARRWLRVSEDERGSVRSLTTCARINACGVCMPRDVMYVRGHYVPGSRQCIHEGSELGCAMFIQGDCVSDAR